MDFWSADLGPVEVDWTCSFIYRVAVLVECKTASYTLGIYPLITLLFSRLDGPRKRSQNCSFEVAKWSRLGGGHEFYRL